MDQMDTAEARVKAHFLTLPPEIHHHIIRYCGVTQVHSLLLVNRYLHNVVKGRLRDILISACRKDYLPEIDQLYEFPADDSLALWKVVRTIHCLDQFRNFVISNIRWDKAASPVSIDKRRAVYLLDHYTRLCLPWGHNIPWFQSFSCDNSPWCYDDLLDCLSTDDVMSMRVVESIMEEQVAPRIAGPEFDFSRAWAEFAASRGFEFFLRIIARPVSYRKHRRLSSLPPWPWDIRTFHGSRHLYLSLEVYELLQQAIQTPGTPEVLIRRHLERQDREDSSDRVCKTQFNDMWKVWL